MTDSEFEAEYRKKWMTLEQWECAVMLADLMRGFHHIRAEIKPCGRTGIECNQPWHGAATYDFDGLTRAVLMAHDRSIRFCVSPSGPGRLRLTLHKRYRRDGALHERHPTIETVVEEFNARKAKGLI